MTLISVAEAKARVLDGVVPLEAERIELADALGRVLAEDVAATRTQPPEAVSAMDGYAVRAADVATVPAKLTVIGAAPAGRPFAGIVEPGQSVRIFTGGVVPQGADAIVIQEDTETDGDSVIVKESAKPGAFVRSAGMDFRKGDVLLPQGLRLQPRHIALAAAANQAMLPVARRARVGILATGDELVPPGTDPGPGQIVSSNNAGIAAFAEALGAIPIGLGIAQDTEASLAEALARAHAADLDILVTLGGASVGDHDLVMPALEQAGLKRSFWRIAMRPGKPLMFGTMGTVRVLGLPGNPVSTMVCARLFLRPLLAALHGWDDADDHPVPARLAAPLGANDRRQDYLRAVLTRNADGLAEVAPFGKQDSSMLATLARANCLIVRAPHAPAIAAGETVEVLMLNEA